MSSAIVEEVRIPRQDWEPFVSKNQQLIERCERLFNELLATRKNNESLRGQLEEAHKGRRLCEDELLSLQQATDKEMFQSGETLSQLRHSMEQLILQTKEELSEHE